MTIDVLGSTTEDARWSPGGHYVVGVFAECRGLTPGDVDAYSTDLVVFALGEGLIVAHLVDLDDHLVAARVIGDAYRADDELDIARRAHLHRIVEWPFSHVRRIGKKLSDVLRECRNLLLLALHGDVSTLTANLQVERAAPGLTNRSGREGIHVIGFEVRAHEGRSSFSDPPVRLTPRTTGPAAEYWIAVIEQVLITMRWKRSM